MQEPSRSRQRRWSDRYGPWAIVTGASDGIGRAFALALAARGANVVLSARRADRLEDLARIVHGRFQVSTRVIPADLASHGGVERVEVQTRDLDCGLLVACAGFGTSGPLLDAPIERELEMLSVNCGSAIALTHAVGRRLRARGRGGVVLMSSIVAFQGVPRAASYAATKAYVQALAEGLAREWAPHGVDVVACAPGPVRSGFGERADVRMAVALQPSDVADATLDALGRRVTIRPGWLSRVLGGSLALTPRSVRVRILARVMGGMTAHQSTRADV